MVPVVPARQRDGRSPAQSPSAKSNVSVAVLAPRAGDRASCALVVGRGTGPTYLTVRQVSALGPRCRSGRSHGGVGGRLRPPRTKPRTRPQTRPRSHRPDSPASIRAAPGQPFAGTASATRSVLRLHGECPIHPWVTRSLTSSARTPYSPHVLSRDSFGLDGNLMGWRSLIRIGSDVTDCPPLRGMGDTEREQAEE